MLIVDTFTRITHRYLPMKLFMSILLTAWFVNFQVLLIYYYFYFFGLARQGSILHFFVCFFFLTQNKKKKLKKIMLSFFKIFTFSKPSSGLDQTLIGGPFWLSGLMFNIPGLLCPLLSHINSKQSVQNKSRRTFVCTIK